MQIYFVDPNAPDVEVSEALYRRRALKGETPNGLRQSLEGVKLTAEVAAAVGFLCVELADPPSYDSASQKAVRTGRVPVSGNTFAQGWEVVPLTSEELDARTEQLALKLSQAKLSKKADITQARINADLSYFEFGGKRIAVDDASMRQIGVTCNCLAETGEFPAQWPGGWKAIDNSYVAIADRATWAEFIRAMGAQGGANFAKQQTLKAQVDVCTNLSQIAAINW